ncbi:hypothetical protein BDV96DRAFT_601306 [Lophiotrema nucula]|uniref:Uncharacterized protein n=1 Tax=Lophiotrema nucula TaxID=690887 RepID=A0A6A5Z342_9PLEO|nr:hypothetical protein BDV96DRAFT_601306 [Lophiotrema nucula]
MVNTPNTPVIRTLTESRYESLPSDHPLKIFEAHTERLKTDISETYLTVNRHIVQVAAHPNDEDVFTNSKEHVRVGLQRMNSYLKELREIIVSLKSGVIIEQYEQALDFHRQVAVQKAASDIEVMKKNVFIVYEGVETLERKARRFGLVPPLTMTTIIKKVGQRLVLNMS